MGNKVDGIEKRCRANPANIRYDDLVKLCAAFFEERSSKGGGSHRTYKTPWQGNPRVNIQKGSNGKAKDYQVKQVIQAIDKLREEAT